MNDALTIRIIVSAIVIAMLEIFAPRFNWALLGGFVLVLGGAFLKARSRKAAAADYK